MGYNAVATCMDSDSDLSIYRRFGALNGRNLLYLQSELHDLETQLHDLDIDADRRTHGNDAWATPRSWRALNRTEGERHLEVVIKLRLRLDEYNRALNHQAWLLSLKGPKRRPWMNMVNYMRANRTEMTETDAHFVRDEFRGDLVALRSEERELLSAFLGRYSFGFFGSKNNKSHSADGQMISFSDGKIRSFVRVLAIVVSSVLPILAIVVLYFIKSPTAQLGAIVAFSALCSTALALLSNAKNFEIIAATAAYGAVQVVFVSGNATSS